MESANVKEDSPPLVERNPPGTNVAAVSIKLPPFWPADPHVWFAQVEAQFATRHITQQRTMFDYVVSSLQPEAVTEVRDLLLAPPENTPYDALKSQLIKRTAASEQRRLQQLFHAEELGDRKPSQFLRRLQQLLGDAAHGFDPKFLRELFLQRLPSNARMVLASSSDDVSLDELAQLADRIMDVSTPTVAAVSSPSMTSELEQLRSEVTRLNALVQKLQLSTRTQPHIRNPRSRSPSPRRPPNLCWYHFRFGDNAQKCRPPCSKSGNDSASR